MASAPDPLRAETVSAEETEALAATLAARLSPGDVVLLSGDLGTGKTTFVRGALRALGVSGPVTSPTFTLARRYDTRAGGVSHLDLYRLEAVDEEDPSLLGDELAPDRIAFVEWPEVGAHGIGGYELAARIAATVELEHAGGDRRRVTITWT